MPTIGCRVHRLRPGFTGAGRRHTASTVFSVVRGEGATVVDGVRLDWSGPLAHGDRIVLDIERVGRLEVGVDGSRAVPYAGRPGRGPSVQRSSI